MNVVWLASWYPNRTSPTTGDFIERHARAVAPFIDSLTIIAVIKDSAMPENGVEIIEQKENNISTYIIYYGAGKWSGLVEKMLSFKKYISLQQQLFNKLFDKNLLPDIVHVQVAMKAGLFAKKLKRKYNIPFVLTEHWTGYHPQSKPGLKEQGLYFSWLSKSIIKNASMFLPVSTDLGKTVNQYLLPVAFKVIPNVVDASLFYYLPKHVSKFRFIHLSYLHFQKNPEGILQACKLLKDKGCIFELQLIGRKDEALQLVATELGLLNEFVFFDDAISYPEVANRMQHASALLLFSRFENLPCVMLEALCCGLPVISSRVGGIAEVIDESNGILVENENTIQLAEAMLLLIKNYESYNRLAIAANAQQLYSYQTVGKQIWEVYDAVISKD